MSGFVVGRVIIVVVTVVVRPSSSSASQLRQTPALTPLTQDVSVVCSAAFAFAISFIAAFFTTFCPRPSPCPIIFQVVVEVGQVVQTSGCQQVRSSSSSAQPTDSQALSDIVDQTSQALLPFFFFFRRRRQQTGRRRQAFQASRRRRPAQAPDSRRRRRQPARLPSARPSFFFFFFSRPPNSQAPHNITSSPSSPAPLRHHRRRRACPPTSSGRPPRRHLSAVVCAGARPPVVGFIDRHLPCRQRQVRSSDARRPGPSLSSRHPSRPAHHPIVAFVAQASGAVVVVRRRQTAAQARPGSPGCAPLPDAAGLPHQAPPPRCAGSAPACCRRLPVIRPDIIVRRQTPLPTFCPSCRCPQAVVVGRQANSVWR